MNQPAIQLAPGVHIGLSNEDYHVYADGISKSHLDVMATGERHYWQAYVNPERPPRETTDAFVLGSAIHAAILEPDLFLAEYTVVPADAPSKPTERQINAKKPSPDTVAAILWWDEFMLMHGDKTLLKPEQMRVALGCRDAVHGHRVARELVRKGRAETTYMAIDPDTGARIKCRTDWESETWGIVDVKSTLHADADGFMKSVLNFRYHVQEPWYRDVISAATDAPCDVPWRFLAIEKHDPFCVGIYTLPKDVVSAGRRAGRADLQAILRCRAEGHWRDYNDDAIVELATPSWMQSRIGPNSAEADFGGFE